jgi:hypothetical protein
MKQTVHFEDFYQAFKSSRANQFSYEGLKTLYENLVRYEEDCGNEFDLDVIALCCEYSEYKNLKDFQENYNEVYKSIKDIEDSTVVFQIPDSTGFVVQNF